MIDLRNIYSLSDFQGNAREHIDRLKRTGRPSVLTVNGSAEIVVRDVASYQEMLDALRAGGRAPVDAFAFEPDFEALLGALVATRISCLTPSPWSCSGTPAAAWTCRR